MESIIYSNGDIEVIHDLREDLLPKYCVQLLC